MLQFGGSEPLLNKEIPQDDNESQSSDNSSEKQSQISHNVDTFTTQDREYMANASLHEH